MLSYQPRGNLQGRSGLGISTTVIPELHLHYSTIFGYHSDLTSHSRSKGLTSRTPTTVRWLGCCWEPEKRVPTYSTATRYRCARGFRVPAIASLSTPVASPPSVAPSGFPAGAGSGGSEDRWSLAGGVGSAWEGSQGRLVETAAAGLLVLMAIAGLRHGWERRQGFWEGSASQKGDLRGQRVKSTNTEGKCVFSSHKYGGNRPPSSSFEDTSQRRRLPPPNSPTAPPAPAAPSPRPLSASEPGRTVRSPALLVFFGVRFIVLVENMLNAGIFLEGRSNHGARVAEGFECIGVLHHGGGPHPRQLRQIRSQPGVSYSFSSPLS